MQFYIEECLPKLMTFINKHHEHDNYMLFGRSWPPHIMPKQRLNGLMNKRYLLYQNVSIRQMFQRLGQSMTSGRY
jgi:hypothetical protein